MTGITADIRTPKQVIALVCSEQADEVAAILVKALETLPGTVIFVENGELNWGHAETE